FSKDYVVINELGQTYFERAKQERSNPARQRDFLQKAAEQFKNTLALDSENVTAHYNLALIYSQLAETALASEHRRLHDRYRPDDKPSNRATAIERCSNPAADNAAKTTVIYSLRQKDND